MWRWRVVLVARTDGVNDARCSLIHYLIAKKGSDASMLEKELLGSILILEKD